MFEKYTEKARRVIFFARYEASQLGSNYIECPHLLLGLLREDKGLFLKLLDSSRPFSIANAAELMGLKAGKEKVSTSVDLPLSMGSKRVLVYAAEESEGLTHEQITTGHLVLGLLRESGPARDLLEKSGLTLPGVRAALTGKASPATNQRIVADLRAQFGVMLERLTPELEPAVVYSPRAEKA
jgi:ATP-dependent Clp protease ATP-binding subunit ClpC